MTSISTTIFLSLSWAMLSTIIVMLICIPLAYGLARGRFPGKTILSAIVSLPLVMPPTAVGYMLLQLLADDGLLGKQMLGFDLDILLTWKGIILACTIMSLPLVVRTARVSFESVNPRLEVMSRTLGHSRIRTFFKITLPLAGRGLIASMILGFTRALGEFGASMMIAGNIPGKTQTLASAIYSAQQSGNEHLGNLLLLTAIVIGFIAVFITEWLSRPKYPRTSRG